MTQQKLTVRAIAALYVIDVRPEITVRELARSLGVSGVNAAQLVLEMVGMKLVEFTSGGSSLNRTVRVTYDGHGYAIARYDCTDEATLGIDLAKLAKLATITLTCEHEDSAIVGNCSAIDPVADKETADWIHKELSRGNQWAWCCVRVSASYAGSTAVDTLGCCSYKSEADFRQPGGYYDDMVSSVLEELATNLGGISRAITEVTS